MKFLCGHPKYPILRILHSGHTLLKLSPEVYNTRMKSHSPEVVVKVSKMVAYKSYVVKGKTITHWMSRLNTLGRTVFDICRSQSFSPRWERVDCGDKIWMWSSWKWKLGELLWQYMIFILF